jgi:hypothetical protein
VPRTVPKMRMNTLLSVPAFFTSDVTTVMS